MGKRNHQGSNKHLTQKFFNSVNAYSTYISIFIAAFSLVFGVITYMMTIKIEEHSNYLSNLQAPCVYSMTIDGKPAFPKEDSLETIVEIKNAKVVFTISSGSILDIGNVVMYDEDTVGQIGSWSVSEHQTDKREVEEKKPRSAKTDSVTYAPKEWNYDPDTKTLYTIIFVKTGNNSSDTWLLVLDRKNDLKIYGYDALPANQQTDYPRAFESYRAARRFLVENNI